MLAIESKGLTGTRNVTQLRSLSILIRNTLESNGTVFIQLSDQLVYPSLSPSFVSAPRDRSFAMPLSIGSRIAGIAKIAFDSTEAMAERERNG